MKLFLFLLPFSSYLAMAQSPIELSEQNLGIRWHNEEIYFLPSDPQSVSSWQGEIFDYSNGTCFSVIHVQPNPPQGKTVKCSAKIIKKAKFDYKKIKDFQRFKQEFLKCLSKQDEECLRPLISKTLQISFGMDGYSDRRELAFKQWGSKDLNEMRKLIEAGVVDGGTTKTFPPAPANEGMGQRGEFKLVDGGWRLTSYLAGD